MENVLFIFAGIPVYSYGFMIGLGLICGSLLTCREGRRRGLDYDAVFSWFVWTTVVFLIAGRIAFVFSMHGWRMFMYPWVLFTGFQVDEAAGLIAAVVGGVVLAIKFFPNPLEFLDILAPGLALIQSFANLGSNVFGRQTTVPWAVQLGYFRLHPMPLYGAIAYYLIFAILWRARRYLRFDGQLIIGFFALSSWTQWFLLRFREMSAVSWSPRIFLVPAAALSILWVYLYVKAPLLPLSKRRVRSPIIGWILSVLAVSLTMTLVFFWRFG